MPSGHAVASTGPRRTEYDETHVWILHQVRSSIPSLCRGAVIGWNENSPNDSHLKTIILHLALAAHKTNRSPLSTRSLVMGLLDMLSVTALVDWAWTYVQPEYELYRVVKTGRPEAVSEYLLKHTTNEIQAAMTYRDDAGRSALFLACCEGYIDILHLMLQHPVIHALAPSHTAAGDNNLLHEACRAGNAEVVRYLLQAGVSPFHLNALFQSPLDLARHLYATRKTAASRFLTCVDMIEQRCIVFEGWLYESTDNLASNLLGAASLQSWKRRYCVVLRTALRTHVEMVLYGFTGDKNDPTDWKRSDAPTSIFLAQIERGNVQFNTKKKIFNSKEFAFSVTCVRKSLHDPQTMLHGGDHHPHEFACVDAAAYESWGHFFVIDIHHLDDPIPSNTKKTHYEANFQPSAPSMASIHFEEVVKPAAVSNPAMTSGPSPAAATGPSTAAAVAAPPLNNECVVCFDHGVEAVCVPCGHHAMCMACATHLFAQGHECPVCRAAIREVIKLYRS
ncbi:Aste57867_9329 [Aphanomyces stellatus]|uniref:Aste57867_9329 protein n=1 Tax=Aphanomyces stellatus TaxID=120398 RepID=A0A485KMR4_9STRA|nr:hypothetical protein As57867_009293 [Aphanomyces stellatus]VFT86211.1 Aste57867_9329 [Aphanomyces stellatus]